MPIIFIVGAVLGFFMYTNPEYQKLKEKIAQNQRIVEANSKATTLRAVRQRLSDDRNKISEADVDKIAKMLPDSVENVGLIIDIDNIASKYGMRIRNTKINDSTSRANAVGPDARKFGAITLSFTVTSAYDNFLLFLQDLESSVRLVDVTGLTFVSTSQSGRYDFSVTLQTYWLK